MRAALLRLFAVLVLVVSSSSAHAYKFGADEEIHFIQDVTLKGAKQEALYLGYMTRTKHFIAGLYVEDLGYVLGVKGEGKRYYELPKGEELAAFQKAGYLPKPLPRYGLGFLDYLVGYSLWWALGLVAIVIGVSYTLKRRAEAPSNAPAPDETASLAATETVHPAATPPA